MHTSTLVLSILVLVTSTNAGAISRLKDAFNTPPEFSHIRDVYEPQNVNIVEVIEPSKASKADSKGKPGSNKIMADRHGIAVIPPASNQNAAFLKADKVIKNDGAPPIGIGLGTGNQKKGIKQDGNVISGVALPLNIGQTSPVSGISVAKPDTRGVALGGQIVLRKKAGKPAAIGRPIGQMFSSNKPVATGQSKVSPAKSSKPGRTGSKLRTNPVANDRLVNTIFENDRKGIKKQPAGKVVAKKKKCDFNIPSFLLPDMSVSQREFEQMYLLPALRAHLIAKECRSRALTVYIDWLLYLRLRNFNV